MGNEIFLFNNRGEIKVYFFFLVYDIINFIFVRVK